MMASAVLGAEVEHATEILEASGLGMTASAVLGAEVEDADARFEAPGTTSAEHDVGVADALVLDFSGGAA